MAKTNRPLASRILYGLLFGVVAGLVTLGVGHYSPSSLAFMRKVATHVFDPLGQVFLRLLFFVVIPLVFASLAAGVAQLGRLIASVRSPVAPSRCSSSTWPSPSASAWR